MSTVPLIAAVTPPQGRANAGPDLAAWTTDHVRKQLEHPDVEMAFVDHVLEHAAKHGRKEWWAAALPVRYAAENPWTFSCPNWLSRCLHVAAQHRPIKSMRGLFHLAVRHHPTMNRTGLLTAMLKHAAVEGDETALNTWLELGANPTAEQSNALYNAAFFSHWPLVTRLLQDDDFKSDAALKQLMQSAVKADRTDVLAICQERWTGACYPNQLFLAALKARSAAHMATALAEMEPSDRTSLVSKHLNEAAGDAELLRCCLPHCMDLEAKARAFWITIQRDDSTAIELLADHFNENPLRWTKVWATAPMSRDLRERAALAGPLDLQRQWAKDHDLPELAARLLAADRDTEGHDRGVARPSRSRRRP